MSGPGRPRPGPPAQAAGRADAPPTTAERISAFRAQHPEVTFTDDDGRTTATWFDDDGPHKETFGTPAKLIGYLEALWRGKHPRPAGNVQDYVDAVAAGDENTARAIITRMQDSGTAEPDGNGGWKVNGNG